jgi:NADH dehydrogenase
MKEMLANIPESGMKRVVIAGAGFGGLRLARRLAGRSFQVVLLDRNNFHSFQPLFYQVAASGIEPGAIAFPLRKIFHGCANIHVRMAAVDRIFPERNMIETGMGRLAYDYLVLATGADNNFFGNDSISRNSLPMKTLYESLQLRNSILDRFEKALAVTDPLEHQRLMTMVIVGGGPTGVEIAGALAEMKRFVLPMDYPELDFSPMRIIVVEGASRLLQAMSEIASLKSLEYLKDMGVDVVLDRQVGDFDGMKALLSDGSSIPTQTLIWAAGIKGAVVEGLGPESVTRGNRVLVDRYCRVKGHDNIFAIGDLACMAEERYPGGHPQVAQAAIQQADLMADNLLLAQRGREMKPFAYADKGALATVGRNRAVVDLKRLRFQGLLAWFFWMFIHLMALVGVKNRLMIFINWAYYYFTYDQSFRLIIRSGDEKSLMR